MGNYLFIVVFNTAGGMHEYAVINASCVHLAQWQSVLSITAVEGILLMQTQYKTSERNVLVVNVVDNSMTMGQCVCAVDHSVCCMQKIRIANCDSHTYTKRDVSHARLAAVFSLLWGLVLYSQCAPLLDKTTPIVYHPSGRFSR